MAPLAGLAPRSARAQTPSAGRWRLASSFPPSLDTIYGSGSIFAESLATATAGELDVEVFAPGDLMPAMGVLDAVSEGQIEIAHTCSYYFTAKDPAFAFGTGMPFGLNSRLQNAWLHAGGGNEILDEFYRTYNVIGIPCGNTGTQMGGWFTRPVDSLADVAGLRMRIAGIAGKVMQAIGAEPVQTPGGEIFGALQRREIDAAEWVGPYDDEKLGFFQVAPYFYYPGWWEPGTTIHLFINRDAWLRLGEANQSAIRSAAAYANMYTQAKYDVQNPAALKRLVANGVELRAFPEDVMRAARTAADAIYDQMADESPAFAAVLPHWQAARDDGYLWWLVNEIAMDAFMVRARAGMAP